MMKRLLLGITILLLSIQGVVALYEVEIVTDTTFATVTETWHTDPTEQQSSPLIPPPTPWTQYTEIYHLADFRIKEAYVYDNQKNKQEKWYEYTYHPNKLIDTYINYEEELSLIAKHIYDASWNLLRIDYSRRSGTLVDQDLVTTKQPLALPGYLQGVLPEEYHISVENGQPQQQPYENIELLFFPSTYQGNPYPPNYQSKKTEYYHVFPYRVYYGDNKKIIKRVWQEYGINKYIEYFNRHPLTGQLLSIVVVDIQGGQPRVIAQYMYTYHSCSNKAEPLDKISLYDIYAGPAFGVAKYDVSDPCLDYAVMVDIVDQQGKSLFQIQYSP